MKFSRLSLCKGLVGACVLGLLVVAGSTQRVDAQGGGQGGYITEAAARLTKLVEQANKDGYKLQDNSFSIGGGWLKQSASDWIPLYTVQLNGGTKYRFLASGDKDAKDVDIEIQDAKGKTVAADVDTAADAKVDFAPKETGRYLVRIRLYDSKDNLPCVCLGIVMSK